MYYVLKLLKTIPADQLQKLKTIGIIDTDALLSKATLPSDREALAHSAGIDIDEITRLASLSDLVRVKGIGIQTAETLVRSRLVGNVQQFLEIMKTQEANTDQGVHCRLKECPAVRAAAIKISQKLKSYANNTPDSRFIPSWRQLIEAAEEALELKPRLVLQIQDHNTEFRRQVFEQWNDERKFLGKHNFGWLLVLVLIVFIPISFLSYIRYQNLAVIAINPLDVKYNQFIYATNVFIGIDSLLLCGILFLLLLIVYLAWRSLSYFLSTHLKLFLFNAKIYQKTYLDIRPDVEKEKRVLWLVISLFAILSLWVIADVLRTSTNNEEIFQLIFERISIFGVLLGAVITFPMLLKLIDFKPKAISDTAVQRYVVYIIIYMSILPVVLLAATQFVIPTTILLHTKLMKFFVLPELNAKITETHAYIENYQPENDEVLSFQQYYLLEIENWNEESVEANYLLDTPESTEFIDLLSSSTKKALLGLFAVVITVLFILPYFIYGGVRKGIFYILLLPLAFFLDNFLQNQSPTWFSSETNPSVAVIIISICLLASALFFDWLYDFIISQKKFCPTCNQELDMYDHYCRLCGLVQPQMPIGQSGLLKLLKKWTLHH